MGLGTGMAHHVHIFANNHFGRFRPKCCYCSQTSDGQDIMAVVHGAVFNDGSPLSLASEFQTREHGNVIDAVAKTHQDGRGMYGTQSMTLCCPADDKDLPVTIDFDIKQALMVYNPRRPTNDELETLPQYMMTSPRTWDPAMYSSSSDEQPPMDTHKRNLYRTSNEIQVPNKVVHSESFGEGIKGNEENDSFGERSEMHDL